MKKNIKTGIVFFIVCLLTLLSYVYFSTNSNRQKNLSYHFDNIVQNVSYDVKGIPTITIEKQDYYLSDGYNFNYKIEKGDSLKKRKGSNIYILIKDHTGEKLHFTNGSY